MTTFLNYSVLDLRPITRIEVILLSVLAFALPIFIGHVVGDNQLILGSLVNAFLFRVALTLDFKRTLPVILLPSLGAVAAGILFGPLSMFLVGFMPFIWIGNTAYVLIAKFVSAQTKEVYVLNFAGVCMASMVKAGMLYAAALLMVNVFDFPPPFLVAMGIFQLYTALIGGTIAALITGTQRRWISQR